MPVVQRLPRGDRRAARVQRLLLRLAQDVRLLLALDAQLVLVRRDLGRRQDLVGLGVVERDPLEPEEDERVLDLGRRGRARTSRGRSPRPRSPPCSGGDTSRPGGARDPARDRRSRRAARGSRPRRAPRSSRGSATRAPARARRAPSTASRASSALAQRSVRSQRMSSARSSVLVTGGTLVEGIRVAKGEAGARPAAGCRPRGAGRRRRCRTSRLRSGTRRPARAR